MINEPFFSLDGPDWVFKDFIGADWQWRSAHAPGSRDQHGWHSGQVPGSLHHDLWQAGVIPNPYFEMNSLLSEWAPQRTWVYKTTFRPPPEWRGRRIRLHFTGVDYAAQFFLNGAPLGEHRSMFIPAVFEIGNLLDWKAENLLAVVLAPAPPEEPQVGYTSRVRTHKSRMTYWWDFCPRMVHLGLWDSVYLEASGPACLTDVWVRPQLTPDLHQAQVTAQVSLSALQPAEVELEVELYDERQFLAAARQQHRLTAGQTQVEFSFQIDSPRLWWPNGHGEQPLYRLITRLRDPSGQVTQQRSETFGLRSLAWVANEAPGRAAHPYTLLVNDRRIYLKGWNWVPIDVCYGVERPAKLARLLELARRAHVNLLRVWGGGLIERRAFYEQCDRLGILVWQEFIQSSSGIENSPPDDPAFIQHMTEEARGIIPRRRNHPSLAIWCGGNELHDAAGIPYDERHPMLAALHAVVAGLDPDRRWLPTSPSGPVFGNSLENIARDPAALHDVHGPWEHQGLEVHFTLYNRGSSLLHSEFGVEGITNQRTLDAVIAREHQTPVSLENPYWFHLGAWWVKAASWRAIFGPIPESVRLVRAVQFLQADGLRYAVEADRRRKYENSGTLPWQFNEPYPMAACTSAVDYYARPKPAYYAVAAAYAPLHVSARFARQTWAGHRRFEAEGWIHHSGQESVRGARLAMALVDASGRVYAARERRVAIPPDAAIRVAALRCPLADLDEDIFFLDLHLRAASGEFLAHNRYIFSRTANLEPMLRVARTALTARVDPVGDRWAITLTNAGAHSALFAWLEDDRPLSATRGVFFDANHFCLLPGEAHTVMADWQEVPQDERGVVISGWNFDTLLL